jgi:hypothetical protein
MRPDTASNAAPLSFDEVLADEYRILHPHAPVSAADARVRHEEAGHIAVCLSGGGVRSASFGLGVLQGLAEARVLESADYLSTVSGGGYIGGWLSAWRLRASQHGEDPPWPRLSASPEAGPITRLRDLVKFLDPHSGWMSADTWTLAGTIVRNLLVTWLLLAPLIACAAMIPRVYLGLLGLPSQPELVARASLDAWYKHDWIAIVALIGIASTYAALELPSLGNRSRGTRSFVVWFLAPVLLLHVVFSIHRFWTLRFGSAPSIAHEVATAAAAMVLPWILGATVSDRPWRPWTWIAAAAAGATGRLLTAAVHGFLAAQATEYPQRFAVIDLPISLTLLFLQFSAFVGIASRDMTDEDREWWARAAAWVLITAAAWLVTSGCAILLPLALDRVVDRMALSHFSARAYATALTLLSGTATYWVAVRTALGSTGWNKLRAIAFSAMAPVAVLLLIAVVADADRVLLTKVHDLNFFNELPHALGASLPEDLIVIALLAIAGLSLGRIIPANRFSLHDMYRARLVRTFLGVSRPPAARHPSRFTGFDRQDDVRLDELTCAGGPIHIVNATMNLVGQGGLALAERKSASFTMTSLHAGSRSLGYRPSAGYAGGLTLGQAITTSGAAVSPNMGAASTPTLTFLLAALNARLGVWLGNPGTPGGAVWRHSDPGFGLATLVDELLGRTTDRSRYVFLSDGGHFENLALYEAIARRCRYVLVSDAGADPTYCFDDLANAIRIVRIDFGVEIDFAPLRIGPPESGTSRWAVATIRYSAVDPMAEDGVLVYLKPALLGDEPVDVVNYARAHEAFPQQSTVNQWFDTAQFESYRMLGLHTVRSLCRNHAASSLKDLCLVLHRGAVCV